jgi:hypothetical protein
MKKTYWTHLAILLVIIFGTSCDRNKNNLSSHETLAEKLFNEDSTRSALKKTRFFVSDAAEGWSIEFIGTYDNFDSLSLRMKKTESDTVKNVTFSLDRWRNPVAVLAYQKEFLQGDRNYVVLYGRSDTLYYYFTNAGSTQKEFVMGEYNYRGSHLGFDQEQEKFYILHKDSLDKVRGNRLPNLPNSGSAGGKN